MDIEILPYLPQYQPWFKKLNQAWIEEYFTLEPVDEWVMDNPEEAILSRGGQIFFAARNQQIIGVAALKWIETAPGVLELTKMAVDKAAQGLGAGKLLCQTAIDLARSMGAKKLVLYSNTSLGPAIGIYRKLGFLEVPVEPGKYARADIKMEIRFQD